jgi:mono/diheme cytochrome c family protein
VDADAIARGAYLARAGNCMGCHTVRGGEEYAGGRGIATPFGTVYAPNLTPDADTGLGAWSASEFRRALRHGRSRDGRLLLPAFPYPSYALLERDDVDAIWAFLRTVPAAAQPNAPHELRWPYGTQAAAAVWRALFFRPREWQRTPARGDEWNRGRYLVEGLGHCGACHTGRNALGAPRSGAGFGGGPMPDDAWYAPSLADPAEAGVQRWSDAQVVRLLKDGVADGAIVTGPMASVVFQATQHLSEPDLRAVAVYLKSLPEPPAAPPAFESAPAAQMARGADLYREHCADCHGDDGRGAPGRWPPLAGNRTVTLPLPHNLVQAIRHGGFAPATAGNPRPYGMPPFGPRLGRDDIAALASYVRQSWGNRAPPVTALDVLRVR